MADQPRLTGPKDTLEVPIANIEAEAALLGGLLIDNRIFDTAVDLVVPEDFYEPVHRRIYEAITNEIANGRIVSPVTLIPYFREDKALEPVGGVNYLAALTADSMGLLMPRELAKQVGDLGRLRRLHDEAWSIVLEMRDFQDASAGGAINPAKWAAKLEGVAFDTSATKAERLSTFTAAESIMRVVDRIKHIQSTGEAVGAIAPDIPELTRVVGPLERKHLHIWAGRPGMGKSALLCGAARSMAANGFGIGVVSLEMGDIDLGQRFAADVCLSLNEAILHAHIRDAKLDAAELKTLEWAAEQIKEMPLKLVDVAGITMGRLGMIARRMKREFESEGKTLDVLFVDYLQLLSSDRQTDNRVGDMTAVSNGLKLLAKELDVAVVALSQLSRQVEQRENKIPQMSDLRETGAIEQDADTICFLYRESYYLANREPDRGEKLREWEAWKEAMDICRDHLDLIVPKRRGGATGKAQVTFLREYQAVRARDYVGKGGLI